MHQALRYALIFLISLALFSGLFILLMVEGSFGYLVAAPCSLQSEPSAVVVHLTEEDFAAHPALYDLVVEGKKVRRPTSFFFLPPPGDGWSTTILSRDEERKLWWTYMFVREGNDTYAPVFLEYEGASFRLSPSQG